MRTQKLLVAVATLAVSAVTSMAQVYSQNIVGYVNVTVPAHGFNLIANQLVSGSDANKTNNDINSLFSGLTSDPNGVNNTVLYKWTGAGYGIYQYFTGADFDTIVGNPPGTSVAGFYDGAGTLAANVSLNQGSGSFLYNPSASGVTVTMVGTVPQTTNVIAVTPGFNIYSFYAPVATNLESSASLANFPGTSDPNGVSNDVLYLWTGNGYGISQYFTAADYDVIVGNPPGTTTTPGFYDGAGTLISSTVPVGRAFFLRHYGATKYWTNSLVVP